MGIFLSCCGATSTETERLTPNVEVKRRQQAEAAERRLKEQESRGIRDPEKLKQKLNRIEKLEKKQDLLPANQNTSKLTWTVG